jgi:hypothetical protein
MKFLLLNFLAIFFYYLLEFIVSLFTEITISTMIVLSIFGYVFAVFGINKLEDLGYV